MITLLINFASIVAGYCMKLIALGQQAKREQQTQMLDAFAARSNSIQDARVAESKESPMSAFNRRVFIFTVLALMVFVQTVPVFWNVQTVVPTVVEGFSLLGFEITPDRTEYVTVKGMLLIQETREVFVMIAELWFGGQMAKGR